MAKKADFTSEEWQLILSMPQVASLYLALASPSNPLGLAQEMVASAKGIVEAIKSSSGNELVDAVAAGPGRQIGGQLAKAPPTDRSGSVASAPVDARPIGMFDSGFGGLTVARALIDLLPVLLLIGVVGPLLSQLDRALPLDDPEVASFLEANAKLKDEEQKFVPETVAPRGGSYVAGPAKRRRYPSGSATVSSWPAARRASGRWG